MSVRVIANATLPVSRWHNGAGRKADVAAGEGWLISFAWLDADAPFSALEGTDRTITLVQGPGFTLDIAGRDPLVVRAPFQPAAFDGGAPTTCQIAGPSRVLNVMTARERFRHTVAIRSVVRMEAAGMVSVAVLLRGAATVRDGNATFTLAVLDAVQLDGVAPVEASADALWADITISRA